MAKMEPTPTGTVEKLTDAELSKILGRYQAMESVSILIGALLVAAGCISAFVVHSRELLAILALSGVALMLLVGFPAQKKKKTLLQQQMGGFFRAKLEQAFGPEPQTPELPIDRAVLSDSGLIIQSWNNCTMTDFHEGHHKSLRFSAANVTLSHTFEEKTAPNSDDWMTRSETIFRGIVVRCGALCDPAADLAVSDWLHKLAEGDQAEPAVFRERFSARTGDGQPADEQVTPELRCFMAGFEKTLGGRLCGLVIRNGELLLALQTGYVFAAIPDVLDLRDINGIRKWYDASLAGMSRLLDVLLESPVIHRA